MKDFNVWEESTIWAYVLDELPPHHKELFESVKEKELLLRTKVLVAELLAGDQDLVPPLHPPQAEQTFNEIRKRFQTDTGTSGTAPLSLYKRITADKVAWRIVCICVGVALLWVAIMAIAKALT